jgi:chromosome segregation ATPase
MSALRRSLGVGAVLLAITGTLVCLSGIAAAWMLKGCVSDVADGVFDAAADALQRVDARLARVETAFQSGAERSAFISKAVQRLRPEELAAKAETIALLKTLDEEVTARLKTAQEWLDATRDVAASVGKVAQTVLSSKYAESHQDAIGLAIAEQVQGFSEQAVEVLASLQEAKDDLIAVRDNVKLARSIIPRVVARLLQVEKRLADTVESIARLRARVAETRQAVADLSRRFRWWTGLATIALAAVFAWFGISQAAMIRHGWSLARGDR